MSVVVETSGEKGCLLSWRHQARGRVCCRGDIGREGVSIVTETSGKLVSVVMETCEGVSTVMETCEGVSVVMETREGMSVVMETAGECL